MSKINLTNWEKISDTEVKLTYSNEKVLIIPYEDFNRGFGAIISASFEEVYRDYVQGTNTILGMAVSTLEIGKPAYIYDAVNDNVTKTSNVEHFVVVNANRTHIITKNSVYDIVTFGNTIIVPEKAVQLVENKLKA